VGSGFTNLQFVLLSMQVTLERFNVSASRARQRAGWVFLLLLTVMLCVPEGAALWSSWRGDAALSHGPLIPIIVAGLLWVRRDRLGSWNAAASPGLLCVALTGLFYIAAVWVDVDFLKPLALIGMTIGGIWFLGGKETMRACVGPLSFLVFMIPWPTTLSDHLAFPMQLASSTYAALLAGIAGVPIHREGVQLYVAPNLGGKPIYSIIVAQQCSGMTSMMVLLAVGYLIAYHTPIKWGWRASMVAFCIPLTVVSNSLRLAIILFAGAHHGAALAKWIHDHEGPVLIFFCSLGLTGARYLLLKWLRPRFEDEGDGHGSVAPAALELPLIVDSSLQPPGS
jgi:exosortase